MTNNTDKQSFGEAGCQIVSGTTQSIPAGQYCAVSFVADTGFTTAFHDTEAPLLSGSETGIVFPAGFTLFTPIRITGTSIGKMTGTAVFYKDL